MASASLHSVESSVIRQQCLTLQFTKLAVGQGSFTSSPSRPQQRQCIHRSFSSTAVAQRGRMSPGRRTLDTWLRDQGHVFRRPRARSTNYLSAYDKSGNLIRGSMAREEQKKSESNEQGDEAKDAATPEETIEDMRPFPTNPQFISEAVLSAALREEIYNRIVSRGQTIREVAIALGVSMERVGAVVRLQTVEADWIREGKKRATFYQRAVLDMLPQTPYKAQRMIKHESIHDLPVHPATQPQLFYMTSESRSFNRADAARAFDDRLLPADDRIPHPEAIEEQRELIKGVPFGERKTAMKNRLADLDARRQAELQAEKETEQKRITSVSARRWDFRFRDISVDDVGKDEKSRNGIGYRYGVPHEDRKRGLIKIPTKVE